MDKSERQTVLSPYLKICLGAFIAVLIPAYWLEYGPSNFLWLSDVVLFMTFFAYLIENKLIGSMAAAAGFIIESIWSLVFFLALFNFRFTSLTDYMFDEKWPLYTRMLSLFHVFLPPLLGWFIVRIGYDKRAWYLQIFVSLSLIWVCWLFTDSAKNINWVFSYKHIPWLSEKPFIYLTALSFLAASIIGVSHLCFLWIERVRYKLFSYESNPEVSQKIH